MTLFNTIQPLAATRDVKHETKSYGLALFGGKVKWLDLDCLDLHIFNATGRIVDAGVDVYQA